MALFRGYNSYGAHSSSGVVYRARFQAMVDDLFITPGSNFSRSNITYDSNRGVCVIVTHTSGFQIAFVVSTDYTAVHADNLATDQTDDMLLVSVKPSDTGTTFDTGSDPKSDATWCADAGATKFLRVHSTPNLYLGSRGFQSVVDEQTGGVKFNLEFIDTPGAPGNTSSFLAVSDCDTHFYTASSMPDDDTDGSTVILWRSGALDPANIYDVWVRDKDNVWIQDGVVTDHEAYVINSNVNYDEPWLRVPLYLAVNNVESSGYIKGHTDPDWLSFIGLTSIASKKKLADTTYEMAHFGDGLLGYYDNGWTLS